MTSEASSEAFTHASLEMVERVWRGLMERRGTWFGCCSVGQRCWVLASDIALAMGPASYSLDVLVLEVQRASYGEGRFEASDRRPVFEVHWERLGAHSSDGRYWLSCTSSGLGCTCGVLDRSVDIWFIQWSATEASSVLRVLASARTLHLDASETYAWNDWGADAREVQPDWLLVDAVLPHLRARLRRVVPGMARLRAHEFIWQCRRILDFRGAPMLMIYSHSGGDGRRVHWVRATTIGWRRRFSNF